MHSCAIDDPGRANADDASEHSPLLVCDDGADNDGNGKIDFDGGTSARGYLATDPDPQCSDPSQNREARSSCGLGAELTLFLAPLMRLLGRRERRPQPRNTEDPHSRGSFGLPSSLETNGLRPQ